MTLKFKAILFDADGVLVKKSKLFSERLAKKQKIGKEIILEFFKKGGEFEKCLAGKIDTKDALKNYLKIWKWKGTVNSLLAFWLAGIVLDKRGLDLAKEMKKKGAKIYLATNNEKYRTNFIVEKLESKIYFNGVLASCLVGELKPSRKYFERVWKIVKKENQKILKNQVMLIDDDLRNVEAAIDFGFCGKFWKS